MISAYFWWSLPDKREMNIFWLIVNCIKKIDCQSLIVWQKWLTHFKFPKYLQIQTLCWTGNDFVEPTHAVARLIFLAFFVQFFSIKKQTNFRKTVSCSFFYTSSSLSFCVYFFIFLFFFCFDSNWDYFLTLFYLLWFVWTTNRIWIVFSSNNMRFYSEFYLAVFFVKRKKYWNFFFWIILNLL